MSYARYPRLENCEVNGCVISIDDPLNVDLGKILHQAKFMKFISLDTERLDVNNSVLRFGIRDGGWGLRYDSGELLLC